MRSTWLRNPAFDLGLLAFAWVPFYLWAVFGLGVGTSAQTREGLQLAIVVALGVTYVHRHYTMVVVYGDPTTFATRARAFLIAPVLVFAAVIAARLTKGIDLGTFAGQRLSPWMLVLFISGSWNIWHTVQQRYGILRIYGGKAAGGLESRGHARRDRALVWGSVAATAALVLLFRAETLLQHGRARRSMAAVGHLLEHPAIFGALVAVLVGVGVLFVWWLTGELAARVPLRERLPRLAFLGSTLALFAVFVVHGPVMGYLVFGTAHALEYIAFVHHFGARKFEARPEDRSPAALLLRHPSRFAPVLVGGLVAAYALLRVWNDTDVYLAYYFGTSLLHFLYDGWIWKVRKPEVARPLGVARVRAALIVCLAACGSPLEIEGQGVNARVGDGTLSLVDDAGHTLLGHVRFAAGRADETVEHQFGAFRFVETNRVMAPVDTSAATVSFAENAATIVVTAPPGDDRLVVSFDCRGGEHFLGLGGQSFDVDHRGQNVPIWVSEDGIGKAETDEVSGLWFLEGRRHSTHTPIPAYLSSRGYSLVLGGSRRSIFDLCAADPDRVSIEVWGPRLELTVFAAEDPAAGVRRLAAHFGHPQLPPPFAFAPWLDALYGSANVRRVAAALRAADVPVSVIWTEDWRGGNDEGDAYVLEEDWEVDRALYPDFETLAVDLHATGLKFLVYYNSFLMSSTGTYAEAVAGGYTIHAADGSPYHFDGATFEPTSLLDFTNPAAFAWGKAKLGEAIALGADGWMADFAEWLPTDAVLASGEDPYAAHNLYPVEWARLNHEVLDGAVDGVERLFFLRSAYSGSQPLVSVVWAGDQQTDFSRGDGYPSVIPIGIGLGITGFPYFGHDIGGYMSVGTRPTTEELWRRWVTLGALSPVMRTHHGRSAHDNWSWETDAAATEHFRRWATLHIRLFPYLYALAADPGLPMMRPLALEHPDFEPGWTSTDEYLLGDRILVAPVVVEGATSRRVELPPGDWYPLLGGPALSGSPTVTAEATEIPAFVPAGAMLVLLPEGIDTLAPASDAEVVTLDDVGEDREIWIWPGGDSELVEAGGLRYQWSGASLAGRPNVAMWNGAPVAVGETLALTGSGTLTLDGATLTITGRADRRLVIRLRGVTF